MDYRILGPVEVRSGGVPRYVGGPREHRTLALLLLNANRVVGADRLVHVLWGEAPPPTAATQIRNTIAALRRHLAAIGVGPAPIARAGAGFILSAREDDLDHLVFERRIRQAQRLAEQGRHEAASDALSDALNLWRGPALGGLGGPVLDAEAHRLEETRLACRQRRIELELSLGRAAGLVGELAALVHQHPLREGLVELQIRALHAAGRRQEALDTYTALRRRLADELGLDPRPELVRLHQSVLSGEAQHIGDRQADTPHTPNPAQLPPDIASFTGRVAHLRELDDLIEGGDSPATVVIWSIAGMAGIGKTALAVHWAHRAAPRFPDGQLYVNLRGFDPGGCVMTSADALRAFLDALGVPPRRIPADLIAQTGLYRSLLAGRRMLVVLDNVSDAEQVRPLLPGAPGCLVLITSRNELTGLVAADGARPLAIDLMSNVEAYGLLAQRLGHQRVAAEPTATTEILACCAGLPLALVIVAARAATRPRFPLAALADELTRAGQRLDPFTGTDPLTDARAVFSWSYHVLTDAAARLFRLLALHPGPDFSPAVAASMAGLTPDETRTPLAELIAAHLILERRPGRYAYHDLLRVYARELVHQEETDPERRAVVHRMLDHYLRTGHSAALALEPHRDQIVLLPAADAVAPEEPPDALEWFDVEHATLLAVITAATEHRLDVFVPQMAWTLDTYLSRRGHWHDWVTVQSAARAAAERLGDKEAQARAHRLLGDACVLLGRDEDAHTHLEQALDLYRQLADHAGQAHTHHNLARLHERQGHPAELLAHSQQALKLYRTAGHKVGQARTLNAIGWYHILRGDYPNGIRYCEEALELHHANADARSEADTWDSLGLAHHRLGDHTQAITCYTRAIDLFRRFGDRYNEATTLHRLGDSHAAQHDADAAEKRWRQSLLIYRELSHADAELVQAKLGSRGDARA